MCAPSPHSPPKARFQLLSDIHLELPPPPASRGKPIIFTRPPPPASPSKRISRFLPSGWLSSTTKSETSSAAASPHPTPPTQGMSYEIFPIPQTSAPYLLLAGDIGNLSHYPQYLAFLRIQAEKFNHIYLVLGNHEFYHLSGGHAEGLALAAQLETELDGKLTVLSRTRVDLVNEGVTVLGCTLWSRITYEQKERISGAVSDFRGRIKGKWGVEEHNREFERDMEWLKSQLTEIEEEDSDGRGVMAERWGSGNGKSRWRVLVATHHSPTYWKCSKPEHEGRGFSSAFCTELLFTRTNNEGYGKATSDGLVNWKGSEKIAAWAFGHTHFCTDYLWSGESVPPKEEASSQPIGHTDTSSPGRKVRIVANQRGYWISSEDNKFDPGFVLEV
ncbi:hypothetical protein EV426DRAFT_605800 [Tirmania nivea]|nr:hypothetical protein EV426DRAFT_605800 [Tirmania nivea]